MEMNSGEKSYRFTWFNGMYRPFLHPLKILVLPQDRKYRGVQCTLALWKVNKLVIFISSRFRAQFLGRGIFKRTPRPWKLYNSLKFWFALPENAKSKSCLPWKTAIWSLNLTFSTFTISCYQNFEHVSTSGRVSPGDERLIDYFV